MHDDDPRGHSMLTLVLRAAEQRCISAAGTLVRKRHGDPPVVEETVSRCQKAGR